MQVDQFHEPTRVAPRSHTRKNVLLGVPPNYYFPFSRRGYERGVFLTVLLSCQKESRCPQAVKVEKCT
jgi:hypothetical protein